MRIARNAYILARLAGWGAGARFARHALKLAFAARLDELSALCLLLRAKLLRG